MPYSFLRNGWYTENYTRALGSRPKTGTVVGSAREGRVATATRRDYAAAAAVVLTGDGHENTVYELCGDTAWSMPELAAVVAEASGRPVAYDVCPPRGTRKSSSRPACPPRPPPCSPRSTPRSPTAGSPTPGYARGAHRPADDAAADDDRRRAGRTDARA